MKKTRPLKDSATARLLRLLFTVGLAITLAIVFIRMVLPDGEHVNPAPKPETNSALSPGYTSEGRLEEPAGPGTTVPEDAQGEEGTYRGEGAEPADNPRLSWQLTLDMSGGTLSLLKGTVVVTDFAGEPPVSDLSFSIDPSRYRINLIESEATSVNLDGSYNPATASLFSINDKNQFFIYLTPKKLGLQAKALPPRFLPERENSPLITLQGFIRTDKKIVGTFHSTFGLDFEYVLEPLTDE